MIKFLGCFKAKFVLKFIVSSENKNVDILGKCAFSWWISWANVHSHGGYLGQMCALTVDILGKCTMYSRGGYLGQMCILVVDILGKCAFSWWISRANVHYYGKYLLNSEEDVERTERLVGFVSVKWVSLRSGVATTIGRQ